MGNGFHGCVYQRLSHCIRNDSNSLVSFVWLSTHTQIYIYLCMYVCMYIYIYVSPCAFIIFSSFSAVCELDAMACLVRWFTCIELWTVPSFPHANDRVGSLSSQELVLLHMEQWHDPEGILSLHPFGNGNHTAYLWWNGDGLLLFYPHY